ncbi:MAG: alanine--glyoxylate aminotransferase family protein [Acidobacteria bacterium]|nr:alanine--glyoxylate aminotransferase family protein [Acidobacteriota bacterium]
MLPAAERLLLGPGPSPISPRVMRALGAPMLSHLDPQFVEIMDDLRARLARVYQAPDGSFAFAVSGTGTSGMELAVANLVQPGTRVLSVVTGYFADRLAHICTRYGGTVTRIEAEWGRAIDPEAVRRALKASAADVVTVVHAETSTGVLNPVQEIAALAHEQGAIVVVDAVTSLGGMPLDVGAWDLDAVYSCSQKCLGAPSGLSPVVFTPRALERRVECRSFYLDLGLLEDYWVRRKYHHTMSASLIYALREALMAVEEEGLAARWARHERHHRALTAGVEALGLSLLPPAGERLWTLNAIRVPAGADEASARQHLLQRFNMEVGAGLGPLAGKIFRVGLMGAGSTAAMVALCLDALGDALHVQKAIASPGAGTAAALRVLGE